MTCNLSKALFASMAALVFSTSAPAASLTVVHAFKGGHDGLQPRSTLASDGQGNFYGTTSDGGGGGCDAGCGTVYRIAADGTETVVYAFKGKSDGAFPEAGVTLAPDGTIYGTTAQGGGFTSCDFQGCGTVFRITPDGQESIIHAFGSGTDGFFPQAAITLDKKGKLYGTALGGGQYKHGVVFVLTPKGVEKVLHDFGSDEQDGLQPLTKLVADEQGNLYGTTQSGGANASGTVFKITPRGRYSVFYSFERYSYRPISDLMIGNDGNFYGTTFQGGNSDYGVAFKLTPSGTETVLHSFDGYSKGDGGHPEGGLIADADGNLFGTTVDDGDGGPGVVFKLAPDGTYKQLYTFAKVKHGYGPVGTLTADGAGKLYGVTYEGGANNEQCLEGCGTVFRLAP